MTACPCGGAGGIPHLLWASWRTVCPLAEQLVSGCGVFDPARSSQGHQGSATSPAGSDAVELVPESTR